MKLTVLPSLEVLFSADNDRIAELQQLGLTTGTELALFSPKILTETAGLTKSTTLYIEKAFEHHNIRPRDDDESLKDAIVRLHGSVEAAPLEVLNFTVEDEQVLFAPLTSLLEWIYDSYPHIVSIVQIRYENEFAMDEWSMYEEWLKFDKRLTALGV
ncbi:MAG: hypothetical protein JWN12_812 [Candidatus Saccharibacteria bacterium]|nr:hypothetical protein [Candidatus Saccharibacteria bacterium]